MKTPTKRSIKNRLIVALALALLTITTAWARAPIAKDFVAAEVETPADVLSSTKMRVMISPLDPSIPEFALSVNPNPEENCIHLSWAPDTEPVRITLFDLNGKSVFKKQVEEEQSLALYISQFQRGVYILRIQQATSRRVQSFRVEIVK